MHRLEGESVLYLLMEQHIGQCDCSRANKNEKYKRGGQRDLHKIEYVSLDFILIAMGSHKGMEKSDF